MTALFFEQPPCNSSPVLPDDADNSIGFGVGFTHALGDRCESCGHTEAHCARTGRCCDGCNHFVLSARQRPAEHGTDRGYYRHRRAPRTAPCAPCKAAHARREQERKS